MSAGTKICPECAEEVKAAARVCRFCRHRFDATGQRSSPPPQGSTPPPRSAIGRLRRNRVVKLLAATAVVAGAAAGSVAALDHESAVRKHEACQRQVQPAISAIQSLHSRLDVGLNQEAYSSQVGDAKAIVDRVDTSLEPECEAVAGGLREVAAIHTVASQEWNACITDEYCDEPSVWPYWDKAENAFAWARHVLAGIRGGDVTGADLAADDAAKSAARTAALAMETFATDRTDEYVDGTYAGAHASALVRIEPALKDVELTVGATPDTYDVSVTSPTENEFTVTKKSGGSYGRCFKPGRAGCPQSGFWYVADP
jgi:hypothetical protein